MYEKVFEQAESFFKPFNDMIALNMEALDKIREQQTELYNELMADGIEYAKDLSKPSLDIAEIFASQQSYIEGVKDKITASAYSSYDCWADAQGKSGELWQSALDNSAKDMSPPPAAPKKKASAKKATKKSAAKVEQAVEDAQASVESAASNAE
ncbi:hypothetical protein TDB9533_04394 [Thalassocella blandensis]|nr:hypothetical protein TDB9533_04394 [Thalassocella blandensis]